MDGSVTIRSADVKRHTITIQASNGLQGGYWPPKGPEKDYCKLDGQSAGIVSWDFKKPEKAEKTDAPHVVVSISGIKLKNPKGPDGNPKCFADLSIYKFLSGGGEKQAH